MGLFDRSRPEPATGRALVHGVSVPKEPAAMYHRVRLVLEVHLDGRTPYAATVTTFAPHHKLPEKGDWLPVSVDPRNAKRVRVVWDEVASDGVAPDSGPATDRPPTLDEVAPLVPAAPPEAAQAPVVAAEAPVAAEEPVAVPAAGPRVSPAAVPESSARPAVDPAVGTPEDDLVGRLERLVRLRDLGAIDEQEFAAAKQRLLEPDRS